MTETTVTVNKGVTHKPLFDKKTLEPPPWVKIVRKSGSIKGTDTWQPSIEQICGFETSAFRKQQPPPKKASNKKKKNSNGKKQMLSNATNHSTRLLDGAGGSGDAKDEVNQSDASMS